MLGTRDGDVEIKFSFCQREGGGKSSRVCMIIPPLSDFVFLSFLFLSLLK